MHKTYSYPDLFVELEQETHLYVETFASPFHMCWFPLIGAVEWTAIVLLMYVCPEFVISGH